MKRGTAVLPLHGGKAPKWLMDRMTRLAREIIIIIVSDFGSKEVLRKLSDPFWFQSFGCLLGFDWHSSGVTTTVTAAVKRGISGLEKELDLFAAGGKGARSRKTPDEILNHGNDISANPNDLVYLSRFSAKVDNNAVMDGYQIYLHNFLFTKDGSWAVIQQGMNEGQRTARRYHWLGETVDDMVSDPQAAICCDKKGDIITNLSDSRATSAREIATKIANEHPDTIVKELEKIKQNTKNVDFTLPRRHEVTADDINPKRLYKIFLSTYEKRPKDFEALLTAKGVGPKTLRALTLIAEVIYGTNASFTDPARFSFAHGGKDGHPYPVDRENYDNSIDTLRKAAQAAKVGRTEKVDALKKLDRFYKNFSNDILSEKDKTKRR
jgi:uncharacterized protein